MKIQGGDLPLAERLLGIAQLTFFQYYAQRMELAWLKAEIAAAREDWPHALSLGEEVIDWISSPRSKWPWQRWEGSLWDRHIPFEHHGY